jgi:hypothetical protein
MDYIGAIATRPDPPGVDRARWLELIERHPQLRPAPPIEGINPFTRQPMVVTPRPDTADVVAASHKLGTICWCEHEANELQVLGNPRNAEALVQVAREIAASLGASFFSREELEREG